MSRDEVKVAPNIYKTARGWRVYVRRRDPETRKSKLTPKRLPSTMTIEEVEDFRDSFKLESKRINREARRTKSTTARELAGTFEKDASSYLELKTTRAMPSYKDRARDIKLWIAAFGRRARKSISTKDIDEQLQHWIDGGYAASTVNNRRTALMAMFTRLDGRAAANPVREARVFEEPELAPRGIPIRYVQYILEAIPDAISFSHLRPTKEKPLVSKPRILIEALTGMRPSQVGQLRAGAHYSIDERWYVIPRSQKGQSRRGRSPRPMTRKHMTEQQAQAFMRFRDLKCEGSYSPSSRRRLFNQAVKAAQQRLETEGSTYRYPKDLVPYDLRHSFATEMLRQTKNLETVAELIDHSTTRMTKRYALAAVPDVLKDAAAAFESASPWTPDATPRATKPPRPPRPRRKGVTPSQVTGGT